MGYRVEHREIGTVAFLANPAAGRGAGAFAAAAARERLHERGIEVDVLDAPDAEAARESVRSVLDDARHDALVVCGGDGLMSLALQFQAESTVPLGVVPGGTGNDLARTLGIPHEPRAAVDVVAEGRSAAMDLGRITPRGERPGAPSWFATVACSGFDSLVTERTNRISWPRGRMRYNVATALEIARFRPIPARIVLDGERVIDEPVLLCTIGNTTTYGGGIAICPHADHRDGLFDVTLMRGISRLKMVTHFRKAQSGEHEGVEGVTMLRARRLDIDMPGIMACADGETFAPSPVSVEVVPGAGRFLVPRAEAERAAAVSGS